MTRLTRGNLSLALGALILASMPYWSDPHDMQPASTALIAAHGLNRRFGDLVAVEDISIDLQPGRAHALIGPHGAGKSTLINLLRGTLRPDEGTIFLNDTDITSLPDWRCAQAGIGRSFQRTNLFPAMTVVENVRLAAQGAVHGWHLLRGARDDAGTRSQAVAALEQVGLAAFAPEFAGALSHGQRRLLEIALVLTTSPGVSLLDEPLAGLGAEETAPVVALLQALAANFAMPLVEHDMDVVFILADEITAMVDGRSLESGTRDAIRRSAAVLDAYLGHRE
jgi:branched-chain amino acid transport system ATP-binding protein